MYTHNKQNPHTLSRSLMSSALGVVGRGPCFGIESGLGFGWLAMGALVYGSGCRPSTHKVQHKQNSLTSAAINSFTPPQTISL